jgi:uncharacterized protein YegJ (DUF2314 family)
MMPGAFLRAFATVLAASIASIAVVQAQSSAVATPPHAPAAVSGVMADDMRVELAVYFLPTAPRDPLALARELAPQPAYGFELVDALPEHPRTRSLQLVLVADVAQSYAPADARALGYFGRGISREQAQRLQQSKMALRLLFAVPRAQVWVALDAADRLVAEIARSEGGLVWDEATRETFSPEALRERRAFEPAAAPDIAQHTVIHAYQNDEYARAISLGMSKAGLPDVVVEDFAWSLNKPMGDVVVAVQQALAEGRIANTTGKVDLDLRTIANAAVRARLLADMKEDGRHVVHLTLVAGRHDKGDPDNRLIEVRFNAYPGKDAHERQLAMASQVFVDSDEVINVKHDDDIKRASEEARTHLPELRKAFAKGLAPGEFIQLKAPFDTDDGGTEWMWVEVSRWQSDGRISGMLKNEPEQIADLHAGASVDIDEADVFDWMRTRADGSREGNTTSAILQRTQKED